ncbi:MAG: hypothetical protein KC910_09550 [Candidatus Eremiobacteraeota bacterium]|nr:hypothetical protein [Candidatus Eremiobacteraeota bacterium]
MTRQLEQTLTSFVVACWSWTLAHLGLLLLILAAVLLWRRLEPQAAARVASWTGLTVLVVVLVRLLAGVASVTLQRFDQSRNALYSTGQTDSGQDTIQYAPSAAVEELTSREQSLYFSPRAFEMSGLASLPGWNGDGVVESPSIVDIQDRLEQSGQTTWVRRKLVFRRYLSVPLELSDLQLDLRFVPDSVAYQSHFRASYLFRNPLDRKARLRFNFPLPLNSGTLNDFQMAVNGERSPAIWEGEVEAGAQVKVDISYRNRGRRSWTYSPTQQRASIGHLTLKLTSDNHEIKFGRDSLFPTDGNAGDWQWKLSDVITSQDISLYFPTTSKRERMARALEFGPLGMLLMLGLTAMAGGRDPRQLALLALTFGGSLVLASYLWTYLGFASAVIIGALVGAGISLACGQPRLVVAAFVLWLCFCWSGQTGVLLTMAGLAILTWWGQSGNFSPATGNNCPAQVSPKSAQPDKL